MRKFALVAILAVLPSIATAQELRLRGFAEGNVGLALINSVTTKPFTSGTAFGTFNGELDVNYSNEATVGVEGGVEYGPWRLGASWDHLSLSFDGATANGTIGGVPISGGGGILSGLAGYLITIGNSVNVLQATGSYTLPKLGPIEPYIGIGLGAAPIENVGTEFALSGTLGARFPILQRAYLGARYRFTWISGPTDNRGVRYDAFMIHAFSAVIGFRFG